MGRPLTKLDMEMGKNKYRLLSPIRYHSKRYNKDITVEEGYVSDGASGPATDIVSESWWVHDKVRGTKKWDDGTECTNLQASYVIYDILKSEGRWFRARSWFIATLIYGEILDRSPSRVVH